MTSYYKPVLALLLASLLTGCANTELVSDIDPQIDMSDIRTFHVVKFRNDNRGIEKLLSDRLNNMGFKASSGTTTISPQKVDAIIEYQDKWMWDITMYMLELNVDFRDPETNYKFASARSYRTSLARKSPEEMVEEVLNEIFKANKGNVE